MSGLTGEEIVISGISGMFPDAQNVQQLSEKLYNKVDMVTKSNRYKDVTHPELPQYFGEVQGMEHFDCQFFRVTSKQAKWMDPVMGKILEHTFSAIFDAGINPEKVSSRLGVYIGCAQIDSVNFMFSDIKGSSFVISGGSKCMLANRISYWINGKGPSYNVDNGSTGSMCALELAYNAMKNGEIECAIVGGCNYCCKPELTINMKRAGLLCLDGKTKCFDKHGDGYVRSDAVTVYFLQKAKDAKRVYAEVVHVKGKYFASPDGKFSPKRNPRDIENFLQEFYSEAKVNPKEVGYVEANSFGIAEADENELEAIGNVFAKEKSTKIGSINSNLGNTECASGASAIIKLCLAYQNGLMPGNLHYSEPQNQLSAIKENKLRVVTDNEPFDGNLTALNNFCYTGNNFHALLKGHFKEKKKELHKTSVPRLVLVSAREDDDVNCMLDLLEKNPIDAEQLALLNNIFKHNIPGYTRRGYTILETRDNETVSLTRSFQYYSGKPRPVWFLYSGMGSQWAGMGEGLLKVPAFAESIHRCNSYVKSKGVDLIEILTEKDGKQLNILKSLLAITSMQIALTDVLKSVGIVPDNILGHSVGEIGSAYGDGSLTAEQAMLTSYARAIATFQTKFIKGTMAAVGLGYKEVVQLCPPEIDIACHNSSESATIAGPAEDVSRFVKTLTDRGVFAKQVDSYNIAFHSRYIAEAGPKVLKLLKEVITEPKRRSSKWLSTCYPPEDWNKTESQYACAEYFAHNLMSSVLLEEAASYIPEDAIIIEIAPHGLMQAIMKRSHSECVNIPLTKRGEPDTPKFLLNAIGKLYELGLNVDVEPLYPKVEYPVSTSTPLLSHFVRWGQQTHWKFEASDSIPESPITKEFVFSIHDDEFSFLKDYIRNNENILPETALLVFAWETLCSYEKKKYKSTAVVFDNVTFHNQVPIKVDEVQKFQVTIQKGNRQFEILHKNKLVAEGKVNIVENVERQFPQIPNSQTDKQLTRNDVYTLARMQGYDYDGEFQSILSMNLNRNKATVKWNDEWIIFLDSLVQVQTQHIAQESTSWVKYIRKLTIDTIGHRYKSTTANGIESYNVVYSADTGVITAGAVILEDLILKSVPKSETRLDIDKYLKTTSSAKAKNSMAVCGTNGLQALKLVAAEQNNADNLIWIEAPVVSNKTSVQVHYSGLSTKDCRRLKSPENQGFGMDFSGVDKNGRRVMGLVPCGAVSSTVEADPDLLWPVPQHWNLAEAATVPLPYVHALYLLKIRHSVSKNSTVLIIGAAGALGQALISVALHTGCRVLATVGNVAKKRFLLRLFPQLDEKCIGFTYDNFKSMVVEQTRTRNCDVVICPASGSVREDAMTLVGSYSFFLDLNDSEEHVNEQLKMAYLNGDKTYKCVNMSTIFQDGEKYKQSLHRMVIEGISEGYIKPLTSVTYAPWEVSRAFKLLSNRSNRGRAIIQVKDVESANRLLNQIPRMVLYPNKAYIVVSDGSELGVELVNLLIQRGAKRILLHCNPKTINGYFHVRYALWKKLGATIEINSEDLQVEAKCRKFLRDVESLGFFDLDGVFVAFNNFESQNNIINENAKDIASIVANLDKITQKCKTLRYFTIITAATQEAEVFNGKREIDLCCSQRNTIGLPSLHISHVTDSKVWNWKSLQILFSGLETSLVRQLVSVATSTRTADLSDNDHTDFEAGFKAFYRKSTRHEFDATEPLIQMKTKVSSTNELEATLGQEDSYIFLIPGFDSNVESLVPIAERLHKPAVALQTDVFSDTNSLPEIAKNVLKLIKSRYHMKSPFHLVGYSFGVNIALEVAALLEEEGLVGVIHCIDSSPDAIRGHLDAYLKMTSEEQLQNSLIGHFYSEFVGESSTDLEEKLKNTEAWSEKVDLFCKKIKSKVQYSQEYMKRSLEATYNRIELAKVYRPNFVLKSKLVLLKGIDHPNSKLVSTDYNLSVLSEKHVEVYNLESDHAKALEDCRVTNYINRSLQQ